MITISQAHAYELLLSANTRQRKYDLTAAFGRANMTASNQPRLTMM